MHDIEHGVELQGGVANAGAVVRVGGHILNGEGRRVGHFTRMLATGKDGLRARHEEIRLAEEARGTGFARALHAHAEATYIRMEVGYITMHAEYVGSILWPRLGFDFEGSWHDGRLAAAAVAAVVAVGSVIWTSTRRMPTSR